MKRVTWENRVVHLKDLKPWESNPRHLTTEQARRLVESFEEFGQVESIAIGPDCEVYNGHQRLSVLLNLHGPNYQIDARQSSRALTDAERKKLVTYLHAGAVGSWDWDILASWDTEELYNWGFDTQLLRNFNEDAMNLREMLRSEEELDYNEEWKGMPEFHQEKVFGAVKSLIIHFPTEKDIQDFAQLIDQTVTMLTRYIWFPPRERAKLYLHKCKDEDDSGETPGDGRKSEL